MEQSVLQDSVRRELSATMLQKQSSRISDVGTFHIPIYN